MANETPRTNPEIPTSLLESGKQGRLADAAGGNWLFAGRLVDHHHGFCAESFGMTFCDEADPGHVVFPPSLTWDCV